MKMHSVSKLILRSWPEKWQRQKTSFEDVIKDRLWRTRGVRQAEIKQMSVKNLHEKYPPLKSGKWLSKKMLFFSCVGRSSQGCSTPALRSRTG